jgi:tetratricopeptide (TPR) repeat protein
VSARLAFFLSVAAYLAVIGPFTGYLKHRPVAEKMGYLPEAKALKYLVADHRSLVAEWAVLKVMFYYGGLIKPDNGVIRFVAPPEYQTMFRTLQTALWLDPYDMDAYYFAQAAFTWDVGRIREVNNLLDYGMRHRIWDYQLPFFAGFNTAYFLKDYSRAADYMKRAAELSGEPLFTTLAARYFYEAGREDLGIIFLDSMEMRVKDEKVKSLLQSRRDALAEVRKIRLAADNYRKVTGRDPSSLEELVREGFLPRIPRDPYGGKFYLAPEGEVGSTSRFAPSHKK